MAVLEGLGALEYYFFEAGSRSRTAGHMAQVRAWEEGM